MLFRTLLIIAALALPRTALSEDGSCFHLDGSQATDHVPCFGNDTLSRCCGPDQFCLTNKLCLDTSGPEPAKISRGSCSDPNFGPSCPSICKGINDGDMIELLSCGDPKMGVFCCDEGDKFECCESPAKHLTLGFGITLGGDLGSLTATAMPNALSTSSGEMTKPPFHTSAVHQPPLAPAQTESSSFTSLPQPPPQISVAQSALMPCLTPSLPMPAPLKESISSMPNASPAVSSQSTSQPSAPAQPSSILPPPQPPPGGSIISSPKASSAPFSLSSQSNQPLVQSSTATTQPPPAPVHTSVQISSATVPQTSLDPKKSIIPTPQSVVGTSPATPVSSPHRRTRSFTPEESGGGVAKPQTPIYPSLASTKLISGTTSISRTTSISSPFSVNSAIADATAGSVIISSPPVSNVAIISSIVGGGIILSSLGFLAYMLLQRRSAKRKDGGQGSNYTGGLQRASTGNYSRGQNEISAFGLQYEKSHGGPNPTTIGAPPINSGMAGLRGNSTSSQTETEVVMAEMDRINALRSTDLNRPMAPAQQMNGMGNTEQRIDVPTNGYYGKRDSDWSVPTSRSEQQDGTSELSASGVYSIPQGGEMVNGTRSPGGGPTIASPTAAWIPAPGLEQRVPQDASRDSYSTMNSEMFEKLLYDVQSKPF